MKVTEEMIEAACSHHWPGPWPGDRSEQVLAMRREDMRMALTAALSAQEWAAEVKDDIESCQVCAEPLNGDDLCATDIEMGICHAACLEGSPTVDLETGDPIDGPIGTFRFGHTEPAVSASDKT